MAKRNREHQSLGEVLKAFIGSRKKLSKSLERVSARDAWHRVMGPAISKYTDNIVLEQNTLYVSLSSSVLREELSYGKEKIVALMQEEMGNETVKKVILR